MTLFAFCHGSRKNHKHDMPWHYINIGQAGHGHSLCRKSDDHFMHPLASPTFNPHSEIFTLIFNFYTLLTPFPIGYLLFRYSQRLVLCSEKCHKNISLYAKISNCLKTVFSYKITVFISYSLQLLIASINAIFRKIIFFELI